MAHQRYHHTLGESGHVQCPSCGGKDEAQVTHRDDALHLIDGRTVVVTVPVWTCLLCQDSWTDFVAEGIRDRAVQTRTGEAPRQGRKRPRKEA